jgi:hypothetical protein
MRVRALILLNECEAGNSPPDIGGGGCAINKKKRSHRSGADGVVGIAEVFRFLEMVPFLTTPSAPLKEASRLLIDVASSPPMSGGECLALQVLQREGENPEVFECS